LADSADQAKGLRGEKEVIERGLCQLKRKGYSFLSQKYIRKKMAFT